MVELLCTAIYISIFAFFDLDIKLFLFLGLAALSLLRGLQGKGVHLLSYLKLFGKKYTCNNAFQFIASALFIGYFLLVNESFFRTDAFIVLPSLTIYIFYLVFYTEEC